MDGLLAINEGNSYTREQDREHVASLGELLSSVSIPIGLIVNPTGVANQIITDLAVEGIKGALNLLYPDSSNDQQAGDATPSTSETIANSTRFNPDPTLNTIVALALANTVATPAHANNPSDPTSGVTSTIASMPSPGTSVEDPRNNRDTSVATSIAA